MTATPPWTSQALGLRVSPTGSTSGHCVTDLVVPGLRSNPRRAHLLVSTVLGKHIAVAPDAIIAAGRELGTLVAEKISGTVDVIGLAETATALGHCVAAQLGAGVYIHSTRRRVPSPPAYVSFEEGHSHATAHTLRPTVPGLLSARRTLVIVDDEMSTGATALEIIRALHKDNARPGYILAALVDLRDDAWHEASTRVAEELGTRIGAVSLATGRVTLPAGLVETVGALGPPVLNAVSARRAAASRRVQLRWPAAVPDGGRHGFLSGDWERFDAAVRSVAITLTDHLDGRPTLIVGHEEFMYLPLRVAGELAAQGVRVLFQSTTRSPAYVFDDPGYPLRRGYQFTACETGEPAPRFLYNGWPDGDVQYVLMVDGGVDPARVSEPGGIEDVLTAAGHDVLIAAVCGADVAALSAYRRHGAA